MSSSTVSSSIVIGSSTATATTGATCTCGASDLRPPVDRGRRLLRLDRAVDAGQVTTAEAAERRVQLLAR
jgi:hypothetical protein